MGWVINATPRPFYTGERPIAYEAGWAPGMVWIGAENFTPLGFNPQTVKPVASRCTYWAIPAHCAATLPLLCDRINAMAVKLQQHDMLAQVG